jgi:uncharacterized protein (DUF1330 family)
MQFNADEARRLRETWPAGKPMYAVNMLKFRPGGAALYKKYLEAAEPFTRNLSAEIIVYCKPRHELVGEHDDWDAIFVVKYPNLDAFFALMSNREYQAVEKKFRQPSLARARLVASSGWDVMKARL